MATDGFEPSFPENIWRTDHYTMRVEIILILNEMVWI